VEHVSPPNTTTVHDLLGRPLVSGSVDAGRRFSLLNQSGLIQLSMDGRGHVSHYVHDGMQRLTTVTQGGEGDAQKCVERMAYGENSPFYAQHNQCGKLVRHDDTGGTLIHAGYSLTGLSSDPTEALSPRN